MMKTLKLITGLLAVSLASSTDVCAGTPIEGRPTGGVVSSLSYGAKEGIQGGIKEATKTLMDRWDEGERESTLKAMEERFGKYLTKAIEQALERVDKKLSGSKKDIRASIVEVRNGLHKANDLMGGIQRKDVKQLVFLTKMLVFSMSAFFMGLIAVKFIYPVVLRMYTRKLPSIRTKGQVSDKSEPAVEGQ